MFRLAAGDMMLRRGADGAAAWVCRSVGIAQHREFPAEALQSLQVYLHCGMALLVVGYLCDDAAIGVGA